jgi:hypothetical protein
LDGRDARPHTNPIVYGYRSDESLRHPKSSATPRGAQKTNPTLALGMRKDGALRRLAGLMNLVPTNLVVVNLLVLTGFVPQGQFDSVPQS